MRKMTVRHSRLFTIFGSLKFGCESLLSHVQCAAFEFDQCSRGCTLVLNSSHFRVGLYVAGILVSDGSLLVVASDE